MKVKFTDRQLLCVVNEDPIYVHSNITVLPKEIGQVNCAVAEDANIVFTMQGMHLFTGNYLLSVSQNQKLFRTIISLSNCRVLENLL